MKTILLCVLLSFQAVLAISQDLAKQQIKIDTIQGHGYEILFVSNPISRKIYVKTSAGVKQDIKQLYRPIEYKWESVLSLLDSIKSGWALPTTTQLETIYKSSQSDMDKSGIRLGSLDYVGVSGSYWCYNGVMSNEPVTKLVYIGGVIGESFHKGEGFDADPNKYGNFTVAKENYKVILIRKY
ncbi:hypothetical protein [Mucilaginibacter sp. L196]|uniref:hypothetical protein n=1 Tax=Mucilaginibacter sp. L196 TaxID=1641870 RepID=UPI00131E95CA|nr:hypothetical protein [Mucilaginibacter sp. L196]